MIKKLICSLAVFVIFLAPVVGHAAAIKAGEEFTLRIGETITDDLYAVSGSVVSAGDIIGDFVAAGGTAIVSGVVGQDLILAAGTVHVSGAVRDDARIAGGNIFIEGVVNDDLMVAGGQVTVISGSSVGGNLVVAGGMVSVDGIVNGDARIAGGKVIIKDRIGGDVHIMADEVVIASTAVINGSLTYRSPNEAQIEPGAQVAGTINFQRHGKSHAPIASSVKGISLSILAGLWSVAHVMKFLTLLVLALLFIFAYGRIAETVVDKGARDFWKSLLFGFITLIMMPIAAVISFVTVVGLPLGIILILAYIVWLIFAWVIAPVILGSIALRMIKKQSKLEVNWKSVAIGCVLMLVLGFIPVVGWIVKFGFILVAVGVILQLKYDYLIAHR